ncbi:DNA-directed RNA polymerase [Candidatus Woesearchaeota archaeon]|nr:DNA-directed RNA polymerase [Candidatus Woesearchaeota archaeon]
MREFNRGGGYRRDFGRDSSTPPQKFKAVCTDCKAECEVPFEPKQGRPVRCMPCHKKFKGY